MAKLANRAKMGTSTTGTGTITLGTAKAGFLSFADAGISNGDVVRYVIEDGDAFEIGTGTYTASGTTLSRTVSESSNSDSAINLSGNDEVSVFIAATKDDFVNANEGGTFSGDVTFTGDLTGDLTGTADKSDQIYVQATATDAEHKILSYRGTASNNYRDVYYDPEVTYNPVTATVRAGGFTIKDEGPLKIENNAETFSTSLHATAPTADRDIYLQDADGTLAFDDEATTSAKGLMSSADKTKLDGIESSATADQTGAEIKTAYEAEDDTNAFTDALKTKLDGIETSADVTDTANVTAAGAVMDSELTNEAAVKAINQGLTTTSDVTFNDVTVSGDLTVSGTTTYVDTTHLNVSDNQIILNYDAAGTPTESAGIEIERGDETNKTLIWDEANDRWTVGSETFVAGYFSGDGSNLTNVAASTVRVNESSDNNQDYNVLFSDTDGVGNVQMAPTQDNDGLTFNPYTNTLTVQRFAAADEIHHKADEDTKISFGTNTITLTGGNVDLFKAIKGTTSNALQALVPMYYSKDSYLIFEGATSNDNELIIQVADPTADRTITFPDATGTVALTDDLYTDSDVDTHLNTSTATTGQYLSWDGSDYDWAAVPEGYADSDVDTHLNTSSATSNQVLSWDGSDYAWVDDSDTTYSNATTTTDGLMSSTDKTKLDGVESSADVTDTANVVAALTAGTNVTIAADGTISSTDTDTTYSNATTTTDGLMSSSDKTKLDGVETGATADQTKADIDALGIDAATLDGFDTSTSGDRWGVIPYVADDGVMEVGKYIDFHESDDDTSDNSVRLYSASGTLNSNSSFDISGSLDVSQSISVGSRLIHKGDSNTYIEFDDDLMVFQCGGRNFARYEEGTFTDNLYLQAPVTVTDSFSIQDSGSYYAYLSAGTLTANRTLTFPDASGTVALDDVATTSANGLMSSTDKTKLDGIESNATADMTASEILTAIKTVDGGGSGLDADTLDGLQSSSFLRSDAADTVGGKLTFPDGDNAPEFKEIRYTDAKGMKVIQTYMGTSYFTSGEYQKVVRVTPSANSQNWHIRGRIIAQSGSVTQVLNVNSSLRSNTLPDLQWTNAYTEELSTTSSRYIEPYLWTDETNGDFIFVVKVLAQIYGNITVELDIIERNTGFLDDVTVYREPITEQTTVDTGYTENAFDRLTLLTTDKLDVGGNITLSGTVDGVDIASRDAVLTSTTTTANAALPKAGGTMTGALKLEGGSYSSGVDSETNAALVIESGQEIFGDNGNYLRTLLKWTTDSDIEIGQNGTALIAGINLKPGASGNAKVNGQRLFAEDYHPNADKWTDARTITLGGDLSGNVSLDGSANVTLTATVANDSHTHSFNNLTGKTSGTGEYSTSSNITSGRGSGGVSLTINDGYGNANVTWNHKGGVPEQNGQAARIEVNTDSTTGTGYFDFDVSASPVTSGTAVNLPLAMRLYPTSVDIPSQIRHHGDTDTYMNFNAADSWQLVTGGTERLAVNNTSITAAEPIQAPSFEATSDINLKENIAPVEDALTKISKLGGYTYNFKDKPDVPRAGLIAQEVQDVLPEAVKTYDDGVLRLDYSGTIALLVEAIKDQQKQIDELMGKQHG